VARALGSGGMGRVYLADDLVSGVRVAVKVVAPPVDARSRDSYGRFVREARLVGALRHPNIVAVVDFHESLGLMALEFMPGGTLADRLPGPLGAAAVQRIVRDVTLALEASHAQGVIHRDVKPSNIFFSAAGDAKLGDFGVAHLQDLGATQTAGFIGTLAYMSPEQISGAPLTFASDVYALGVTTFQMLTGRLPFPGPDFVGQHLGSPAPLASALRPELAPGWDALTARMLAKAPAQRFASLEELRHALAAIPTAGVGAVVREQPEPPPARSEAARYEVRGTFAETDHSILLQAVDTRLGRMRSSACGPASSTESAARVTRSGYVPWPRPGARASSGCCAWCAAPRRGWTRATAS
jgi:serine/threonine-protein kinase